MIYMPMPRSIINLITKMLSSGRSLDDIVTEIQIIFNISEKETEVLIEQIKYVYDSFERIIK